MIVVCGESLVDLVAEGDVLRPHLGGGPFNVAVALGHLEVPVGFCSRMSTDVFGERLRARLRESGVDLGYVVPGPEPTTLALVQVGPRGDAEYTFYLEGTADRLLRLEEVPPVADDVIALHFGTLSLATEPAASTYESLMAREAGRRLIVLDPNVRPMVIGDRSAYVRRFESWTRHADVVKLSDADAAWLYPGDPVDVVAARLVDSGVGLVAATLGPRGSFAITGAGHALEASPPVAVVDTVGAGDAFGAGVMRWLWEAGLLERDAVSSLGSRDLGEALTFANTVAALTCSRAGAQPPTLAEVRAARGSAPAPGDAR